MALKRFSLPSFFLVISLVCAACAARNALYSGQRLNPGQSLNEGSYVLTMQADCNLVLYAGAAVWSSGTFRAGVNCYASMQYDGNFVVYNGANQPLWSSRTALGSGNYVLVLQFDRNLVVYGPARWSTGTNVAVQGFGPLAINATTKEVAAPGKP